MNVTQDQEALVERIDQLYIDLVGPIGHLLIDDAQNLWRKNQWQGNSALKKYIAFLAENIAYPEDRRAFIEAAGLTTQTIIDPTHINAQAG